MAIMDEYMQVRREGGMDGWREGGREGGREGPAEPAEEGPAELVGLHHKGGYTQCVGMFLLTFYLD